MGWVRVDEGGLVQAMAADGGRIQCRAEPALSIVGRSLHAGRLYVYSISLLHPWLLRLHPALVPAYASTARANRPEGGRAGRPRKALGRRPVPAQGQCGRRAGGARGR